METKRHSLSLHALRTIPNPHNRPKPTRHPQPIPRTQPQRTKKQPAPPTNQHTRPQPNPNPHHSAIRKVATNPNRNAGSTQPHTLRRQPHHRNQRPTKRLNTPTGNSPQQPQHNTSHDQNHKATPKRTQHNRTDAQKLKTMLASTRRLPNRLSLQPHTPVGRHQRG